MRSRGKNVEEEKDLEENLEEEEEMQYKENRIVHLPKKESILNKEP